MTPQALKTLSRPLTQGRAAARDPGPTRRWSVMRDDELISANAATLLTVREAAQRSGVSRHIISSWITRGELPAVRIAGRRYVRPADLAVDPGPPPRRGGGADLAQRPAARRHATAHVAAGRGIESAATGRRERADARGHLPAGGGAVDAVRGNRARSRPGLAVSSRSASSPTTRSG